MFLNYFTKIPAFKLLLITLIFAIAFSYLLDYFSYLIIFSILILASVFSFFVLKSKLIAYLTFAAAIGVTLATNVENSNYTLPDKLIPEFRASIEGKITKITKREDSFAQCIITGTIDTPELPKIHNTTIIMKIYGNTDELKSGTFIRTSGYARTPSQKILPTDFDEKTYFAGQGIHWVARANSNNIAWNKEPNNIYSLREKITNSLDKKITLLFDNDTDGLVRAIVLGDKSGIQPETRQAFSLAGTAHVLALSGLHVGIIAFIIFTLLNYIPNKYIKFSIFTFSLLLFVFITGFQPSAIRASFMAVLIALAKTIERDYNILNIISIVVLISLLIQPNLLYSAGFQMSVASIIGIFLLYEPIKKISNMLIANDWFFIKYVKNSIAITVSASAIVSPIVAYYFNIFSIISPITNLIVIPLISFAYIFSLITILLSYISMPLSLFYSESATFLLLLSEKINLIASGFNFSAIEGKYSLIISIFFLFSIIYITLSDNKKQVIFRTISSIFVTLLIIINLNINQAKKTDLVIYPRNQVTVALLKVNENHSFIYIADRKPSQMPRTDFGLIRYLNGLEDSLTVAVNGNAGINTADFLREKRDFHYIELNPQMQKFIEKTYFPNIELSQIIEVKK